MKTNNYKREIPSFINKYKVHILVLIAILGIGLLGCENKAAADTGAGTGTGTGTGQQEYYRFTSIVAGEKHTVGIAEDGTLWAWGYNNLGQLGDGTTSDTINKSTPVRVQKTGVETFIDNITKWKAVSAGGAHTVGLAEDETLWSWGWNSNGQLGDGTTANKSTLVRVQKTGITWKAVSAGEKHTVGIAEDGTLWSWGWNNKGQLGDGTTANKSTPVRVQKTEEKTLNKSPPVRVQKTEEKTLNKSTPVRVQKTEEKTFVDNTTKWKVVSAGKNHTVGIAEDGTLWSWGWNSNGQLGDGTTANKSTPVRVQKIEAGTFIDNTTKWNAVAAGERHTVAIDSDGTLWSWGYNGEGQLGNGTTANKSTPVRVKQVGKIAGAFVNNTTKWKAVSAGGRDTVGIAEDGSLWSWGKNNEGQLGLGNLGIDASDSITQISLPRQVGSQNWKAVLAGANHTVGIAEDGSLWSWGYNNLGQLGDGTVTSRNTPVKIQIPK